MEAGNQREDVEARRLTYSFLSSMYLEEVSQDFLGQLASNPPFTDGELGQFFASLPSADLEAVRVDAAAEFASLLLNMSADPVSPFESVYTSGDHLLMQQARDEVLAAYRAEGFERSDVVNVPEDHVGIEFEFMARLCQKELEALDAGDEGTAAAARVAQRAFLEGHLVNWVPQLCEDIERRATSGLYRGLAETTRQFLAFECDELGVS